MTTRTELVRIIEALAEVAFRSHGHSGRPVVRAILATHRAWLAAQSVEKK